MSERRAERFTLPHAIAAGAGALMAGLGLWAFFSPRSFYDTLATFPPYNVHLFHDVGAFQVGIGVTLLAALRFRDALLAALTGFAAGAVLHGVSHFIDADKGGRATDPWSLGLLAAVAVGGAVLRARDLRRRS